MTVTMSPNAVITTLKEMLISGEVKSVLVNNLEGPEIGKFLVTRIPSVSRTDMYFESIN